MAHLPQVMLAELLKSTLLAADLSAVLRDALPILARSFAVQHCSILEWSPERGVVLLRAAQGWPQVDLNQPFLDAAATKTATASTYWNDGANIVDWSKEQRFSQPAMLKDMGIVSSLGVPIQSSQMFFGFLAVHTVSRRVFTNEEWDLLRTAANVLALGIARFNPELLTEEQLHIRLRAQERQRLARELHDSVTQALFGVTLHAEAASRLLAFGDVTVAAGYLRDLQATAQEALDEMRLLIFELRPQILEQEGLVAALQDRLDTVEGRAKLQASFEVEGDRRLPIDIEQALYRIAREALNNALKHARAQTVRVLLQHAPSLVVMEIGDDGVGFEPVIAREKGGMGLRGIEERVDQLGGRLLISSAPGAGAVIRVEVTV